MYVIFDACIQFKNTIIKVIYILLLPIVISMQMFMQLGLYVHIIRMPKIYSMSGFMCEYTVVNCS